VASRAEALLGAGAQALPHKIRDSRLAECDRTDRHGGRVARDLRKQPSVGPLLGRAGGARYEDPQALEPALEVDNEPKRRLVTPVKVVDREQQRPVRGDARREPEQAVQDVEGDVARSAPVAGRAERAGCRLCRAGQPLRPLSRIGQERLEQLPDDAERELLLEVAPSCRKDPKASRARHLTSSRKQPRLPDPGRTLDKRKGCIALVRSLHQLLQHAKLALTLQQHVLAARRQ
jgi:hypothetical protein